MHSDRSLRFARSLALLGIVTSAGCAASVSPGDGSVVADAPAETTVTSSCSSARAGQPCSPEGMSCSSDAGGPCEGFLMCVRFGGAPATWQWGGGCEGPLPPPELSA